MMRKQDFLKLGGHDPILHSAREDSDIFNRMFLAGYTFKQVWQSLVYHLTGRGGQFQHGAITQEHSQKSLEWQKLMENSTKEFIRKWGTPVLHTPLMKPIVPPKYDIGFQVYYCNSELLEILEPWCSNILIEDEMQIITAPYLEKEQKNTIFNLSTKIKSTPFEALSNDIIVKIDRLTFSQQDFQVIQQLPQIIKDSGQIGRFEIGNLVIEINQMNEYQNQLINL
jgi:hypothetical protein